MDYLYVDQGRYILAICDNLSQFLHLSFCESADAEAASNALIQFASQFGLREQTTIVSDKGSHFANKLLTELSKDLNFSQDFAVSYCPWTNGVIEVRNTAILTHLKVILSEYGALDEEWPKFLPLIQFAINTTPMQSKGNLTPFQIFHAIEEPKEFIQNRLLPVILEKRPRQPLNNLAVRVEIAKIARKMQQHRERAFKFTEFSRKAKLSQVNRKFKVVDMQFQEGDFVLLSRAGTKFIRQKTKLEWGGPFQIVEIHSNNVYTIQEMTSDKQMKVHASRLWFYENDGYIPKDSMKLIFDTQWKTLDVEELKDLKIEHNQIVLLTSWLGLEEVEDSWEPLESLYDTIPNTVEQFVRSLAKNGKEDAKIALDNIKSFKKDPVQVRLMAVQDKKTFLQTCWETLKTRCEPFQENLTIKMTKWTEHKDVLLQRWVERNKQGKTPFALGWFTESEISLRELELKNYPLHQLGIETSELTVYASGLPVITERHRLMLKECIENDIILRAKTEMARKCKDKAGNHCIAIKMPHAALCFKVHGLPYGHWPLQVHWNAATWTEINEYIAKHLSPRTRVAFLINAADQDSIKLPETLTGTVVVTGRAADGSHLRSRLSYLGLRIQDGVVVSRDLQEEKVFLTASDLDANPLQGTICTDGSVKKFIFSKLQSDINFDIVLDGGDARRVENTIQVGKAVFPRCSFVREISLKKKGGCSGPWSGMDKSTR